MSKEKTPIAPGVKSIETIKCAAIKRSDGIILAGRNHAFIIQHSPENTCKNNSQQGFITSTARFVSRSEGGEIAFTAGQITKPTDMLFSEDITQDNPWAGEQVEQLLSPLATEQEKNRWIPAAEGLPKVSDHKEAFGHSKAVEVYYGDMPRKERIEIGIPWGLDVDTYNHTMHVWQTGRVPTHYRLIRLPKGGE